MTIKEQIMQSIKSDPTLYEDKEGIFFNVILPAIESSDEDSIVENILCMLIAQCKMHDTLMDNISRYGNNMLIEKCRKDLLALLDIAVNSSEE